MKRLLAVPLVVSSLMVGPGVAHAGAATDAALALGSFAVLNQLVRGETVLHSLFGGRQVVRETVVVHQPPPVIVHQPPPVIVHQPATVIVQRPPAVVYHAPPAYYYAPPPRRAHFIPPGHAKQQYRHPYRR